MKLFSNQKQQPPQIIFSSYTWISIISIRTSKKDELIAPPYMVLSRVNHGSHCHFLSNKSFIPSYYDNNSSWHENTRAICLVHGIMA